MKYILSFLFGAACGVGGTLLWLRKDIKRELEKLSEASNEPDMPFEMGEHNDEGKEAESLREAKNGRRSEMDIPVAVRDETKLKYNKIINDVKNGVKPELKIPVLPREDYPEAHYEDSDNADDIREEDKETVKEEKACFPIPIEDYKHDDEYEKEYLVYFRGDKIMSTESGTIVETPALLVGVEWESAVGRDIPNTAFIRNPKLSTDYEILVEDGLYEDEYGPPVT